MSLADLVTNNDDVWRRCGAHDELRDPDTKVCDGCAAEARPACTYCFGSGTTAHWSGGLYWPERCRCRRTWPYTHTPNKEDYQP